MQAINLPQEEDFKKWVREVIREELSKTLPKPSQIPYSQYEPLVTRKEIATYLRISLVTLADWVKRGLPRHRKRGRVLFLRSEVLQWVKEFKDENES